MSIVKFSQNRNQLLLDGYRYRRGNKPQIIWRRCKNNCAGLLCFDGIEYVKVTDHAHTSNPKEIISMEFKSILNTGATTSHDPLRRIIHESLLHINKNDRTAVLNYLSTQHTIEKKKENNKINHCQHLLHLMIFLFLMNLG